MHGTVQPGLKLERRKREDLLILDLEGDLDSRSAGVAKEEVRVAIEGGNHRILFNLEGVLYIDSAGLGTLVSALKATKEHAGGVYIAAMTPQVRMVIELTRLDKVLPVFDTVDQAISRLTDPKFSEA